jgi:hypothetical protein
VIRIRDFGEMVRASGILRRIVVPVEKNWHPTDGPRPRGAKAVIDESTAARLSAVVGDGEFSEFAWVAAHGAPEGSATTTAALIRRNTPAAAIAVATLACLWVGNRMNQSLPDTVAHAGADSGSFGEPTAATGPMFGAGRDPGARGGDPAMNLKNSARVAVLAVTAAVTANGALAGDAVQWRVADGGNGHWYQVSSSAANISWAEAKQSAGDAGGYLATLTVEQENRWVFDFVASSADGWFANTGANGRTIDWYGPWIGGFQDLSSTDYAEPGGGWRWMTGEPWGFTAWAPTLPNDGWNGIVNCHHLRLHSASPSRSPQWNDDCVDVCGQPQLALGYIIEWSADCNNDNIVDYGQILNGTLPDTNTNNIPDCCEPGNNCCLGDIYVNHIVDGGDLGVLLSEWGVVTPTTRSDLNQDGFVDGADLGRLLANWGPCGG